MKYMGIVLCVTGCMLLTACGGSSSSDSTTLTAADNGSTVELKVGEVLRISLAANHSTGYSWKIEALDTSVLALVDQQFALSPSCEEGMTGCGGTDTLQFKGMAEGQTTLRLVYSGYGDPLDSILFEVTVQVVP